MISVKSEREIALLKQAGHIVALCLEALKEHVKPGVTTYELDQICEKIILENGGVPSCKGYEGYPCTICASVNEVVVHGIPSKKQKLKEGDIVTVDLVAGFKGYHGDSAYTYKVGKVSPDKEKLLDVTEKALYEGLSKVREGVHLGDVSAAIGAYINQYGYGIIDQYTGHGIGREMHEDPVIFNFGTPGTGPVLKEGMVLAIEPMVSLGTKDVRILKDGWTAAMKDGKPSAHFEHTVVVRKDGYEILTTL
ncbi:MAG: type I methionyl aminopeptidase [Acholeplasmatales bacterium]|nr:type I methionyl aminopeptidase [Acholeplasmatales bacterium]